jgi:hypothetical protein
MKQRKERIQKFAERILSEGKEENLTLQDFLLSLDLARGIIDGAQREKPLSVIYEATEVK